VDVITLGDLSPLLVIIMSAVFAISGSLKLFSLNRFIADLKSLRVKANKTFATAIISIEFVTAGILIYRPLYGSLLAILLLTVFTTVLLRSINSGTSSSCSCFGALSRSEITYKSIIRNAILLTIVVAIYLSS